MTKKLGIRYWLCALLVAAAMVVSAPVQSRAATPNGLSDFMGGVLPPPGVYWLNYFAVIQADKLMDKNGDEVPGLDLDVTAYVDALRFVWMSPYTIMGATYGAQIIFPLYSASFDHNFMADESTASGLGDIIVNPIILAWHFSPEFHVGAGLDIILPTGNWDNSEPAAQLLNGNVYTFEPLVALSYWQKDGFDASIKIMYDISTENTDTGGPDMTPGNEFHFDWALSYAIMSEEWRAGLTGYYYTQTTGDKVDGQPEADKYTVSSIGAAVKYWPKMGPLSFTAKYMKEFNAENGPEGQNFWLNFVWAL